MQAISMSGSILYGIPIIIQATEAEKNKAAEDAQPIDKPKIVSDKPQSPKLFVEGIPLSLTQQDLKDLFSPFGALDFVNLHMDPAGISKGYAFVQYKHVADARAAVRSMDQFELLNKTLSVSHVVEKALKNLADDGDIFDDADGGRMKGMSRMELMAKLARDHIQTAKPKSASPAPAPLETPCILLRNMFDPAKEEAEADGADWAHEIELDVREECASHGTVTHCRVDAASRGHVYVRFSRASEAKAALAALSGRFFAGQQIVGEYVGEREYGEMHPNL